MSPRLLAAPWLAAILAATPAGALAQAPPAPAPTAPTAPSATPPAAAAKAPPAAAKAPVKAVAKKKKGKDDPVTGPVATYPGFRMLDGGGSRVFVTLSKKVNVTEHKAEGKLTYRIQGVRVPTRTNRLPLITTFFSTPVARATLVERDGGDVDLVIELRAATTAQHRVVENDKGAELQVDFPKMASGEAGEEKTETAAATGRPATTKSLDSKASTAY